MSLIEHDGCVDRDRCPGCATEQTLDDLVSAVRSIAHGPVSGPTGLEALSMAIAGSGEFGSSNLSTAITSAASEIAEALHAIARAIDGLDSGQ